MSELIILQLLVDDIGEATITNDGATILKMLEVEHPAAHFSLLDLLSIVLCGCVCVCFGSLSLHPFLVVVFFFYEVAGICGVV